MAKKRTRSSGKPQLFIEHSGQLRLDGKSAEQQAIESQRVECFGLTFENDDARRAYFLERLKEKLPELRKRPDFPLGPEGGPAADEDILRLSDPPYYTASPNPFLEEFVKHYGHPYDPKEPYHREPFAVDVSEGKTEHYYNVHTYHTKVPYRAISRFILHYTYPGDVILDSFCGTGMTALAAQACAAKDFVCGLELDPSCSTERVGARPTLLIDLSPAATHIAANYTSYVDPVEFQRGCEAVLDDFKEHCGWMFSTRDPKSEEVCPVDYYVWSDVFACPNCADEILFWDEGIDKETGHKSTDANITCPKCQAKNHRDDFRRVEETYFDDLLQAVGRRQKEKLVLVVYRAKGGQRTKTPDDFDHAILERVSREPITNPVPVIRMLHRDGAWGDMFRAGYHLGITHFHHFYYRRSLRAVAWLWNRIEASPKHLQGRMRWWLESVGIGHTRLNRYFTSSYSQVNRYLKGFLYIAQVRSEVAPWYSLTGKIRRMTENPPGNGPRAISTASATVLGLPDSSIDYVFTDPPFGGNIMYSELNFLWEAWLRVYTNPGPEAVISSIQRKDLVAYQDLMELCFMEYCRVLKPGRWMTVVFHNSQNAVWVAIQTALEKSGFVVADVRVFDKKQMTMKQQTTAGAVQKDLLISVYKPNGGLEQRFKLEAGTEEGVWDFVRTHMRQLPVFVSKDGRAEVIAERQNYLLFDRMVAFHVQRGVTVPLSAAEFYACLEQRFPVRDGMYFLPEQVAEYDRKRMTVKDVLQLELFVKDEESAIQWLKQQLTRKPQTFQEIHPQFIKELGGWEKHEKQLELLDLLQDNFLRYDGTGEVPSQIHSYLSSNFKELRSLVKGAPTLRAKAKDRWYVPDPRKAGDLEKLRERTLLREFEEYRDGSRKKLKVFRLEAVRAGFKKAWQERDYATIIAVARKIPENVLQEDPKLLMWYDQALTRSGVE